MTTEEQIIKDITAANARLLHNIKAAIYVWENGHPSEDPKTTAIGGRHNTGILMKDIGSAINKYTVEMTPSTGTPQ
jgi:hypothetical protein